MIVAATGGGKTTLYNNLLEQGTQCGDVLFWPIDLGKGTIPAIGDPRWTPRRLDEHERALLILQWAVTVIKERSHTTGGRNHKPTPTSPVIVIPVDEMDTLIGMTSPIAHKAKPMVEEVFRRGRSGVVFAIAGQRGVVQHTGSKDPHANAGNKFVLRVNRPSEMGNVIPDWEAASMPNMASYAQGVRGVALVVDAENNWRAGRVRDMSDLDAVQALADRRGAPTATLETAIAAKLPGYADRHALPVTAGDATTGNPVPGPAAGLVIPIRPGNGDGDGFGPGTGDEAINRLTEDLVAEVEAHLADMPDQPDQPTTLADLIAAKNAIDRAEDNDPATNRDIPVPDYIADPVLTLLTERGADGASPADLVAAVGKGESTVRRWLAIMRDQGLITSRGNTRSTRYYTPQDDTTTDHEQ